MVFSFFEKFDNILLTMTDLVQKIAKKYLPKQAPQIQPGWTVKIHQRIKEGNKTRISMFEGIVIAKKHGNEAGATFTVRKIVSGIGVEKTFPIYSPTIEKIEIIKRSKVRRAKLYYLREKSKKETRKKLRTLVEIAGSENLKESEKEINEKETELKENTAAQENPEVDKNNKI